MDRWAGVPHIDESRARSRPADVPTPRSGPEDGAPGGAQTPRDIARLALVARHTDDAIVIYGPDGRIDWVNEAFVGMSGYSVEEAVGALRTDLIRGPFTRTAAFVRLAEDLAARRDATLEFVTRTKQGAPYWVAMQIRAAVQEGRIVGLIGVERDISTRRVAEERAKLTLRRAESLGVALRHEKRLLTSVLATIPHLVWWKNADLRYIGANEAYLSFRGLKSIAEVVGRREDQLDVSDRLSEAISTVERSVAQTLEPAVDQTVTLDTPRGAQRKFLVSVLPHFDGETLTGVIGIGADVSRVADLERQLAQTTRLESIGQLAAGIAHELNTPVQYVSDNTRFVTDTFGDIIASLREIADLVENGGDDDARLRERLGAILGDLDLEYVAEEVPNALTQSKEGLARVAGIVRAMKDFSHPGHGRADVEINPVVQTTVQVSRSEWKYLAELELDLDPQAGSIPCFEGELKQVLLNLVVNAAHAIEAQRQRTGCEEVGHITLRTRRLTDVLTITVQDDGIGMNESVREHAFDPFFTTKPVGKGTGQGLSLAHDIIVHKHGGRIEIASTPGEGSTFTVHLPLVVPPHLAERRAAAGSCAQPAGSTPETSCPRPTTARWN